MRIQIQKDVFETLQIQSIQFKEKNYVYCVVCSKIGKQNTNAS